MTGLWKALRRLGIDDLAAEETRAWEAWQRARIARRFPQEGDDPEELDRAERAAMADLMVIQEYRAQRAETVTVVVADPRYL